MPPVYALSLRQLYEQVIADVRNGKAPSIHPELYRAYSENLVSGVSGVFAPSSNSDKYLDMQIQFEANTARFAAYKAFHATQQLQRQLADADGVARSPEDFDRMARAVLNTFNRYQAAEYNTAVARARSAKQWTDFSQPDNMFLFPNLRWIPSRSADPREQHIPFYNRVWAKNDPFWNSNQPGNLWNCKCDWEETDDPVTDGNPEGLKPARGLEGNPAKTGQIFTDECTYIKKAGKNAANLIMKEVRKVFRSDHANDSVTFDTNIGKVLFDKITVQEITKGAKTDKSYFYKQQIALHFDHYASMLKYQGDEAIDLSHNNHRSVFYQRKKLFDSMKIYKLNLHGFEFQVKMGEFQDGTLNLYSIIEP